MDHATHDPLLVAEAADRGRSIPPELAACPACTALHADLVALAAALPSSAIPTRPRDFTLTPADAARLRPRGWRRLLGAIGSSRDAVTRPLAIGLTTLGLAGLLVATVPGALPGGAATGALDSVGSPVEAAKSPVMEMPAAASAAPMEMSAAPGGQGEGSEPTDDDGVFAGVDTGDASASPAARNDAPPAPTEELTIREDGSGLSTLVVVAGALLLAGLGLFALRWSARRLG
jgi:hypothetical protein